MTMLESVNPDDLEAAVRASRSWRAVLRALGLPETSSRLGRLLRGLADEQGLDYRHFRNQRAWTEADLAREVARARSWPALLQAMHFPPDNRWGRVVIRGHCARLGLDVSHLGSAETDYSPAEFSEVAPENLRSAGAMIVSSVLALRGHRVSWPLEPAPYDLLVDPGTPPVRRVQVKTTTREVDETWVCEIGRWASDSTPARGRKLPYSVDDLDYFAVVDGDLNVYLIPSQVLGGRRAITVRKYAEYIVGRAPSAPVYARRRVLD